MNEQLLALADEIESAVRFSRNSGNGDIACLYVERWANEIRALTTPSPQADKALIVNRYPHPAAAGVVRLVDSWRERERLDESEVQWMRQKTYEQCANELEDALAPFTTDKQRGSDGGSVPDVQVQEVDRDSFLRSAIGRPHFRL